MHYFKFNIKSYAAATAHLEPMEDLAYRRLLDLYYSEDSALKDDVEFLARKCRMRTHSECIANVLREFFKLEDDGLWHCERCDAEIFDYTAKSDKAANSAKARWRKHKEKQKDKASCERIANAEQSQSEGNANHKPITNNHKPIKKGRFAPPSVEDVKKYCDERGNTVNPEAFVDHYQANNWMRGKSKIKDWKACVRTWEQNQRGPNGHNIGFSQKQSLAERSEAESDIIRARVAAGEFDQRPMGADDPALQNQVELTGGAETGQQGKLYDGVLIVGEENGGLEQ